MFQGLFWLSWSRVSALTDAHGAPQISTFGLELLAMWQAEIVGIWWTFGGKLHRIMLQEKILKQSGGPGNRTQVPMPYETTPSPSVPNARFVYYMTNNYYKKRQTLVGHFRANFKCSNPWPTHHHLLQWCVFPETKTNKIAGVLNPHYILCQKIANRNPCIIN